MLHENILYKGSLQFVHDLPSSLERTSLMLPDVIYSYIVNVNYTNHTCCAYS